MRTCARPVRADKEERDDDRQGDAGGLGRVREPAGDGGALHRADRDRRRGDADRDPRDVGADGAELLGRGPAVRPRRRRRPAARPGGARGPRRAARRLHRGRRLLARRLHAAGARRGERPRADLGPALLRRVERADLPRRPLRALRPRRAADARRALRGRRRGAGSGAGRRHRGLLRDHDPRRAELRPQLLDGRLDLGTVVRRTLVRRRRRPADARHARSCARRSTTTSPCSTGRGRPSRRRWTSWTASPATRRAARR